MEDLEKYDSVEYNRIERCHLNASLRRQVVLFTLSSSTLIETLYKDIRKFSGAEHQCATETQETIEIQEK
jgi:hypothetical protein